MTRALCPKDLGGRLTWNFARTTPFIPCLRVTFPQITLLFEKEKKKKERKRWIQFILNEYVGDNICTRKKIIQGKDIFFFPSLKIFICKCNACKNPKQNNMNEWVPLVGLLSSDALSNGVDVSDLLSDVEVGVVCAVHSLDLDEGSVGLLVTLGTEQK